MDDLPAIKSRTRDHQWHPDRTVVATPLVLAVPGLEVAPVIGGIDDDRVVQLPHLVKRRDKPGDILVKAANCAIVAGKVLSP